MATPSQSAGAPPSVEQIWKAIVGNRLTTEIAEAIYRRLVGDDADTNPDVIEESWRGKARLKQERAFIKAVLDVAERKVPEEKVALALLLEEGGIDKAAERYEKFAFADREAWADRFRTMAGLFAAVKPSAAIQAYARVVAHEPDNEEALFALARLMHRTEDPRAEGWYQRIIDHPGVEPSSRAEAMGELAAFVAQDGRLDVAYDWHEKAYRLYTELGDVFDALRAMYELVVIAEAQGHIDTVELWGEAYVQGHMDWGIDQAAAHMLSYLAGLTRDRNDLALAEARTRKALSLYQKAADKDGVGKELRTLSVYESMRGDNGAAEKLLKEALGYFKQLDDRKNIIDVLDRLTAVSVLQEGFRRAKAYLQEGLDLSETWGDEAIAAYMHEELGRLADTRGDGDVAAYHEKQALERYKRVGDDEKTADMCFAVGRRLFKADDPEGAESHYERSRALYEKIGDRNGVAVASEALGYVNQQQEDRGMAERWFERALAIFTELDNQERVADVSFQLGNLVGGRGDLEGACDHWGRALTRYTNVGKRDSKNAQIVMGLLRMAMRERGLGS